VRTHLFIGLALFAVTAGCKRKPSKVTDMQQPQWGSEEVLPTGMSAVVIQPNRVSANVATRAEIIGSGFQHGASVRVGAIEVAGVAMRDENTLEMTLPGMQAGVYDVLVVNPDGGSSMMLSALVVQDAGVFEERCLDVSVYFALDQATLTADARSVLDGQAACYRQAGRPVRAEGHADERGTTDYNLALGQRRAESVVGYLRSTGVPSSLLSVVSYGEERPARPGHDEVAWAANRRVEVLASR